MPTKFFGELTVAAPRAEVFAALRDARRFAACVDGVRDLTEIGPDRYAAVFETKVAYMKFSFKVTVEVVRAEAPREIEAKQKAPRSASSAGSPRRRSPS